MGVLFGFARCFVMLSAISITVRLSSQQSDRKDRMRVRMLKTKLFKRLDKRSSYQEVNEFNGQDVIAIGQFPDSSGHIAATIKRMSIGAVVSEAFESDSEKDISISEDNKKHTGHTSAETDSTRRVLKSKYHENRILTHENHAIDTYPHISNPLYPDAIKSRKRRDATIERNTVLLNNTENLINESENHDTISNSSTAYDIYDPSCKNMCGQKRLTPCSCDLTCFVLKTCCETVSTDCPSLKEEARAVLGNDLLGDSQIAYCDRQYHYFVVEKCVWPKEPTGSVEGNDVISMLKHMAVVHDNYTGLVFRNQSVYNCYKNNTDTLQPWSASFRLSEDINLKKERTPLGSLSVLDPTKAKFYPASPAIGGHFCLPTVIQSCKKELEYLDPDRLCGKFISYYVEPGRRDRIDLTDMRVYGNRHCFYCNENTTEGQHGIFIDGESHQRSPPMSLLMSYNKAGQGLEINLQIILTLGKIGEWSCSMDDSTIPINTEDRFVKTGPPQCQAQFCHRLTVNHHGHCLARGRAVLLLRHSPRKHFNIHQILRLAKFISCYSENGEWKFNNAKDFLLYHRIVVAKSMGLYEDPQFKKRYRSFKISNVDDYFVIRLLNLNLPSDENFNEAKDRHIAATEHALAYWYVRSGSAEKKNDSLYFVNDQAIFNGSEGRKVGDGQIDFNGCDDDEDYGNDDNIEKITSCPHHRQRNVLTGLILVGLQSATLSAKHNSPYAIGSSETSGVEIDYKTLARCYEDGFVEKGLGENRNAESLANSPSLDLRKFIVLMGGWGIGKLVLFG